MQNREKIIGEKMLDFFEALVMEKIILKMNMMDKDFERLTMVLEVRTRKGIPYLRIDYPEGLRETLDTDTFGKIRFEFTGIDKLFYLFTTSGGEFSRDRIWLRGPEFIERIQRRKDFRLEAPMGTRIYIYGADARYEMNVINVSQKGALVALTKNVQEKERIQIGDHLRYLGLVFPSEEGILEITINEAIVKRIEKDALREHPRIGLQFTDLEKDTERTLKDLIYWFQRQLLRKRERVDS